MLSHNLPELIISQYSVQAANANLHILRETIRDVRTVEDMGRVIYGDFVQGHVQKQYRTELSVFCAIAGRHANGAQKLHGYCI